jgi:hypothetical protein
MVEGLREGLYEDVATPVSPIVQYPDHRLLPGALVYVKAENGESLKGLADMVVYHEQRDHQGLAHPIWFTLTATHGWVRSTRLLLPDSNDQLRTVHSGIRNGGW